MNKASSLTSRVCFDIIVILLQLALVGGFLFVFSAYAKPHWEWELYRATLSTRNTPEVRVYSFMPRRSMAATLLQETPLQGNHTINDVYIGKHLGEISLSFIDEYGTDTVMQYEVITSRKDLFRYRIYDNHKGASWEIWVSMPSNVLKPQIAVIDGSGVSP